MHRGKKAKKEPTEMLKIIHQLSLKNGIFFFSLLHLYNVKNKYVTLIEKL